MLSLRVDKMLLRINPQSDFQSFKEWADALQEIRSRLYYLQLYSQVRVQSAGLPYTYVPETRSGREMEVRHSQKSTESAAA